MFETLPLSLWQRVFLWPGGVFMDWLARTFPDVVIRYGIGFTAESYVFWAGLVSVLFWGGLLLALRGLVRRCRRALA